MHDNFIGQIGYYCARNRKNYFGQIEEENREQLNELDKLGMYVAEILEESDCNE